MTNRTFGVEVEFWWEKSPDAQEIRDEWVERLPVGDPAQIIKGLIDVRAYQVLRRLLPESWKIETEGAVKKTVDAGLTSKRRINAWEVISPVLRGDEGYAEIRRVLGRDLDPLRPQVVTHADEEIDTHVHIGAADLSLEEIKMVMHEYHRRQPEIDLLVASHHRSTHRRTQSEYMTFFKGAAAQPDSVTVSELWDAFKMQWRPDWHRPLGEALDDIDAAKTRAEISNLTRVRALRYRPKFSTLEFRQYHSTLDPEEIIAWVQYCEGLVESVVQHDGGACRARSSSSSSTKTPLAKAPGLN